MTDPASEAPFEAMFDAALLASTAPFDANPPPTPAGPRLRLEKKALLNIPLNQLSRELSLPSWDVLLIGDGSGTGGWKMGAGWACSISVPALNFRDTVWGGWSRCSILLAELSAYHQAIVTFESTRGKELRQVLGGRPYRVVALTDSQGLVLQRDSQNVPSVDTMATWWGLEAFIRHFGIELTMRHIPRLSVTLNWAMDRIAESLRHAVDDPSLAVISNRQGVVNFNAGNPMPARSFVGSNTNSPAVFAPEFLSNNHTSD